MQTDFDTIMKNDLNNGGFGFMKSDKNEMIDTDNYVSENIAQDKIEMIDTDDYIEESLKHKEEGNNYFKAKEFEKAISE